MFDDVASLTTDTLGLASELERHAYLFTHAKVGIALCDAADNRLLMVNPAFASIHGYTPDELIGCSAAAVFASDCMVRLREHESISIGCTDCDVSFETMHLRKDGSFVPVSVQVTVVKDAQGVIKHRIANVQDITAIKTMERTVFEREEMFRALVENTPDGIFRYDLNGRRTYVNPSVEKTFGVPKEQLLGKKPTEVSMLEEARQLEVVLEKVIATGQEINFELGYFDATGRSRWGHMRIVPEYDHTGNISSVLAVGRDLTEKKESDRILNTMTLALNVSSDAISLVDLSTGNFVYVNDTCCRLYGYSREALLDGMSVLDIDPDFTTDIWQTHAADLRQHGHVRVETRNRRRDGYAFPVEVNAHYFKHDGQEYNIAIVRDITEQKAAKKQMEYLAHHDPLIGLPNRILTKKIAERMLEQAQDQHCMTALLYIDLDGFKAINDTLGHSVGDKVLRAIAERIQAHTLPDQILCRQGGDEFLLLLPNLLDATEVENMANTLLSVFESPLDIDDQQLTSGASIGIAMFPDHGDNFETLLQNADMAMYQAKNNGKNAYSFYNQQLNHHLVEQFKIQHDLKSALKHHEFTLHYQPQIDIRTQRIIGAEALIRWHHPELGMISPMQFIPVAESTGMIVPLGEWVLREACQQAAHWRDQGIDIVMAVNISSMQFKRGNLEQIVKQAVNDAGMLSSRLELELTESIMMHDTDNTLQTVRNLKAFGVQLSIDDFGTGYSSLAYLKRFAVDKLKIDQSFVRDILRDPEDSVIVKAIIQMAKSLNLYTIAEGVENPDVLAVLDAHGCDEVQGYYFAKPLAAQDFERYYATYTN